MFCGFSENFKVSNDRGEFLESQHEAVRAYGKTTISCGFHKNSLLRRRRGEARKPR